MGVTICHEIKIFQLITIAVHLKKLSQTGSSNNDLKMVHKEIAETHV